MSKSFAEYVKENNISGRVSVLNPETNPQTFIDNYSYKQECLQDKIFYFLK